MATYLELRDLFDSEAADDLKNKVDVAVVKAASDLLAGTPTADEQKWAAAVFSSTNAESSKAFKAVLAANSGLTVAQITGASDNAVQTNVDSIVPSLVVAFSAGI